MILSGKEIVKRLNTDIFIDGFDPSKVNPNSYNLTLNEKLLVYDCDIIDMKKDNPTRELIIPEEGLVLLPGELYLGRVNERTKTKNLVPMLEGRSSIGRLGIYIHVTAGFGDVGFEGYWTLEITCVRPVRIFANVDVGQMYFHMIEGEFDEYKSNKYQGNNDVQASKMWKDFENTSVANPNNVLVK